MCAAHEHGDPRLAGTRGLMMLTPDFLTINQSEECPRAGLTRRTTLPVSSFPSEISKQTLGREELVLWVMSRRSPQDSWLPQ